MRSLRHAPIWIVLIAVVMVAGGLAACGRQESQTTRSSPTVEEKIIPLSPSAAAVKASFLTGQLEDMKVWERLDKETGKTVDPPKLMAKLKLKNTSANQAARPITGRIEYLDRAGKPIPMTEGREDSSFQFPYYQDRLDPGMEAELPIDVPFPAAALEDGKLRDIRLDLAYIPTPYREESVSIQVSLGK